MRRVGASLMLFAGTAAFGLPPDPCSLTSTVTDAQSDCRHFEWLADYFRTGTFIGGGLGSEQQLSDKPFIATALGEEIFHRSRVERFCGTEALEQLGTRLGPQ